MSFGEDEEILQDFLVEAGEILDQLSEQLVELEKSPGDHNLLNAIFRGFHTVKGGAGFLQLDAMVECCHITENLFDILRNGKRSVTPELMDVVLQALDTVNSQFQQVSQHQEVQRAPAQLISRLERLVSCEDLKSPAAPKPEVKSQAAAPAKPKELPPEKPKASSTSNNGGIALSDDDLAGFLHAVSHEESMSAKLKAPTPSGSSAPSSGPTNTPSSAPAKTSPPVKSPTAKELPAAVDDGSDEITDEEFEALLDQLHGRGMGPSHAESAAVKAVSAVSAATDANGDASSTSNSITDDEFESLLDQLHGVGKGPSVDSEAYEQVNSFKADKASSAANTSYSNNPNHGSITNQNSSAHQSTSSNPNNSANPVKNSNSGNNSSRSNNGYPPNETDLITDNEFEELLDQLHGNGRGPTPRLGGGFDDIVDFPAESTHNASPESVTSFRKSAAASTRSVSEVPSDGNKEQNSSAGKGGDSSASNAAETTVRVDTQRLDDIMNMVGELVLVRNRLVRLGMDSANEALSKAVGNLDVVTADLQSAVMKTRMQPIKKVFGRFPRVVRDLARNLKKEIHLDLVGEDTDLDKNLVEALADPLVHLVRNSVDHGIELPADREAAGKPRVGKVVLAAEQEGDHILLTISDDGAGMDPAKLREKAVEKGILDADTAARMSDIEAFNLIFAPGFSTKTVISDVSGRGVGMDVVKTKITQLNGSIEIQSKKNEGTRFIIKVPLTLAIMPTLMIMVGRQSFALPLVSVNEIFHMDLTKSHVVDGQECVTIRDKAIPIFYLKRWLVRRPVMETNLAESHVVIVTVGSRRVGFVVDQLIGQEEVVIKPLGKMLQGTPGMAGATITGDGTIALILDVPSLLKRYVGGI
jgi:two-component system, chemotaxis family, sensor kinase CheA